MSNGESSPREADVKRKVDLIEGKFDEYKAAERQAFWTRLLVLVVIIIVIAMQIYSVFGMFKDLDKKEYEAAALEELQNMAPKAQEEMKGLAEKLLPVYQEAFLKEYQESMPVIAETFAKEMDLFVLHVGDNINKSLEHRFEQVLQKQLDILAEEMPELKDPEKRDEIMLNVLDACYTATQGLSEELFSEQIHALATLSSTLDSVDVPADIKQKSDTALMYYTLDRVGELFMLKMVIMDEVWKEQPVGSVKREVPIK